MTKDPKFIPQQENANLHSQRGQGMLEHSIRKDGFLAPITVTNDGETIDGSLRLEVAEQVFDGVEPIVIRSHGDRPIIHIREDIPNANTEQAKRLSVAANRVAQVSLAWDAGVLEGWSADGVTDDFWLPDEVKPWEVPDVDPIITDEEDEENTADALEKADKGQIESRVKLGEIWQLGRHRIACCDSTVESNVKALLGDRRFDMIFTDPPYGVNYEGGHFHSGNPNVKRTREKLVNDHSEDIYSKVVPVIAQFCDGPVYTWFAGTKPLSLYQSVYQYGEIHALIIWHKTNATYAAMGAQYKQRHEPCLYWKPKGKTLRWCGASTESTIWEIARDAQNTYHPTQKPTALAEKAIANHDVSLIGDLFLGSGSTLIAAQKMEGDRTVYGCELSPEYCTVILDRFTAFTGITPELVGHIGNHQDSSTQS